MVIRWLFDRSVFFRYLCVLVLEFGPHWLAVQVAARTPIVARLRALIGPTGGDRG